MSDETKKWDYTFEIRKKIRPGSYLLSEPFMADQTFERSVCLICDHSRHDGTFGFILNKSTGKTLDYFFEEMDKSSLEVFYGGPVASDSLYFVHNNSLELEGAKLVREGLYWGGNFEQMKIAMASGLLDPSEIKFFLGYSGWDNGQLRKEIIENGWIVCERAANSLVFDSPKKLWERTLRTMGKLYKEMATFPKNPRLN